MDRNNSPMSPLQGGELLSQLQAGWGSLPTRTVLTLAMGGLRVRMMRSAVTFLSVVLAIAFLSYTGLSHRLQKNLALRVLSLEKGTDIEATQVEQAASTIGALDLLERASPAKLMSLALDLGMADIRDQESTLRGLQDLSKRLMRERDDYMQQTDVLTGKLTELDGASSNADLAEIASIRDEIRRLQVRTSDIPRDLKELRPQIDVLIEKVEVGRWLDTTSATEVSEDDLMVLRLLNAEREHHRQLFSRVESHGRLSGKDLDDIETLLALTATNADEPLSVSLGVMRSFHEQQKRQRAAGDLQMLLRRAAVDIEKTLAPGGNPLDTWLIIMALLTCTVGIANAMLMSVTERFREIGTMKCLGAQDGLVVKLFVLESAVLGIVGALLGLGVGLLVAVSAGVAQFRGFGWVHFPVTQGWSVLAWSLFSGMVLAVAGASYPAFAASRMRPVDALRVDE